MSEDERRDEDGLWKRAGEHGKSWILVEPSGGFYARQNPPREDRPPWQPPESAMTITELIAFLEKQRKKHGNLTVMYTWEGIAHPAVPEAAVNSGTLFLEADREW